MLLHRRVTVLCSVLAGLWLLPHSPVAATSSAAPARLSIMPFDNLSVRERHAYLGRAVAEMLTAEFAQVPQVTLVERQKMESVTREIALGLSGVVDEGTAPKVGALLGAQYLMTGTCAVARRDMRVTYKVIAVESGKVSAAGAAEGSSGNVTSLVKRLFQESLARMATVFPGAKAPQAAAESDSTGVDDVAAFGEALELRDNGSYDKAATVLRDLVGRRPSFAYAKSELRALEERIAEYDRKREEALAAQRKQPLTYQSFLQVTTGYVSSMQYTRLLEYCRSARPNPPAAPEGAIITAAEMIDYYVVLALYSLKRWGEMLPAAEAFLKEHPSSMYYAGVKTYLTQAMNEAQGRDAKRKRAEQAAGPIIAKLEAATDDTRDLLLFQIAMAYFGEGVYESALPWFRRINLGALEQSYQITADNILYSVFTCYHGLQDKPSAARVLKTLETLRPESTMLQAMRTMMAMFPE